MAAGTYVQGQGEAGIQNAKVFAALSSGVGLSPFNILLDEDAR